MKTVSEKINILQIGCNNGNDHVYSFVKNNANNINKLILVDANSNAINECKKTYKEYSFCEFLVSAVTDTNVDTIKFYLPSHDNLSKQASISKQFVHNHNYSDIVEVVVPAIHINSLLDLYSLKHLDYLYIDAEGMDAKLILALNLDSYNINSIFFEHGHTEGSHSSGGENYTNCMNKLVSHGYSISTLKDNNTLARRTVLDSIY